MAERSVRPATADNVGWNTTPTNPSTDPGGALRAAGWATDAIPGSDEFNYLQTMWGDFLQWIEGFAIREWNRIEEGIAAGSFRDLFRVTPQLGDLMSIRLAEVFSLTGTAATGGTVANVCGDGEQVYYVSGSIAQSVIAALPLNGTEVWEAGPVTQAIALTADGLFVYASAAAAQPGLRKINRTTGAAAGNAGAEYAMSKLRANGVYCVGIAPNSNAGSVVFYTVATPVETGVVTPTTQLNGVAIDHDQCYVGGTRNTNDVWAYTLSTRALAWQVTLDTNAPTINDICTDGNYVYVCTDDFVTALPGTPNRCLFCLERISGAVVWSMDIGADLDACTVDDECLYVVTSTGTCYAIDLRGNVGIGGVVASQTNVAASGAIHSDGVSLYCQDGAAATKLRRLATAQKTKAFMCVNGADPARRPFYNLAIPLK